MQSSRYILKQKTEGDAAVVRWRRGESERELETYVPLALCMEGPRLEGSCDMLNPCLCTVKGMKGGIWGVAGSVVQCAGYEMDGEGRGEEGKRKEEGEGEGWWSP